MKALEIIAKWPSAEFGDITVKREMDVVSPEEYERQYENQEYNDKGWRFELPHSCDEWVIGNIEAAEEMRDNLNKAIEYAKANP